MGSIGVPELIFIFVLALLIFGPRKLPELGRTLGRTLSEFRRASSEMRAAVEEEMRDLDRQASAAGREAREAVSIEGQARTPPEGTVGSGTVPTGQVAASHSSPQETPADGGSRSA